MAHADQQTDSQAMKYILRQQNSAATYDIAISQETFDNLSAASECLWAATNLEETYKLLLSAYEALGRKSFRIASNYRLRVFAGCPGYPDNPRNLTDEISYFLRVARWYRNKSPSLVQSCAYGSGNPDHGQTPLTLKSPTGFSYRFMLALQDFIQLQRKQDVDNSELNELLKSREPEGTLNNVDGLYIYKDRLQTRPLFENTIITNMPDKVHLIHAAQEYMKLISEVHDQQIEYLTNYTKNADWLVKNAKAAFDGKSMVHGIYFTSIGTVKKRLLREDVESFSWLSSGDDSRLALIEHNKSSLKLGLTYAETFDRAVRQMSE